MAAIVLTPCKLPVQQSGIHRRHLGGMVVAFDPDAFGAQQREDGKIPDRKTPLNGVGGLPVLGRCGYGTRLPLLVISPWAKDNYVDHTLLDQTSVIRFIEDNFLDGKRIQPGGSFDSIANSIEPMFDFNRPLREVRNRVLILDPETGAILYQ